MCEPLNNTPFNGQFIFYLQKGVYIFFCCFKKDIFQFLWQSNASSLDCLLAALTVTLILKEQVDQHAWFSGAANYKHLSSALACKLPFQYLILYE